jgi:hypothetical protein
VILSDLNEKMAAVATNPDYRRNLKLELMDMVARLENAESRAVRS